MDNQKQMFEGNWGCSSCSAAITQLPFQPKNTNNLLCRDCHGKGATKKMHQGEWSCSKCGGGITELPFEPRETGNLVCRDCFMNRNAS